MLSFAARTGVPAANPGLPDGLPNTGVVAPEAVPDVGEDTGSYE